MANMMGKNRYPIDALLILRDTSAGAVTADTNLAVQKLVSKGAYWQNPADAHDGEVALIVKVGAYTGDTTLQVDIYTTEAADFTTGKKLFASFPIDTNGTLEVELDQYAMLKRDPAATNWFATLNVAGSAPSVATVFAYLSCPDSI